MYKKDFGNIPNKDKIIDYLSSANEDFFGRWIIHAYLLGFSSKNMAKKLGLDEDVAFAAGALVYLGKTQGSEDFIFRTYELLREDSYFYIGNTALLAYFKDRELPAPRRDFLESFLLKHDPSPYSNLVAFVDKLLLVLEERKYGKNFLDQRIDFDEDKFERNYRAYQEALGEDLTSYIPKLKKSKFPLKLFSKDSWEGFDSYLQRK